MSALALPSARHPLWRGLGAVLLAGTVGLTLRFLLSGTAGGLGRTVGGDPLFGEGSKGSLGTLTEQLGPNRMVLTYKTIEGSETDLKLDQVIGRLDEQAGQWRMQSPTAHRRDGIWTLMAPMELEVNAPGSSLVIGRGHIQGDRPGIRWNRGAWEGLAPLRWESLDGAAKGVWELPAGWQREPEGRLRVDRGPVRWQAPADAAERPALQSMEAERLWAMPGFQTGHLEGVQARLSDGSLRASVADLSPETVTWPGPLSFSRQDGWTGDAQGGTAPRPTPGAPFQRVEFRGFRARRNQPTGQESLATQGARWTPAGLRLEGNVIWEQPLDGQRLILRAPRVLMREGVGSDLPAALPIGSAIAEGNAVLSWGQRSLSSPEILVARASRVWHLKGPVLGRAEEGTFTGTSGTGNPHAWTIEGPVQLSFFRGGNLRGSQLLWQDALWTLRGHPAAWSRFRERLSGPRIQRQADVLSFPEGLNGTLAAADGDLFLRAERGKSEGQKITLEGGVEFQGQGWRLAADSVTVLVAADRTVQKIQAQGAVMLRGRLGEGQGEALELEPGTRTVHWQGRVRGKGDGSSW
jgi:hypothetical protein